MKSFKCGLLPHNPVVLARSARLEAHPINKWSAPATLKRDKVKYRPQMFRNDQIGDCTAAGLGNAALAISALNGSTAIVLEPSVVNLYSATSGYNPKVAGSDRGAVLADVLAYQYSQGFHTGAQLLVGPWATFSGLNRNLFGCALDKLGVAILGVALSQHDMAAAENGDTWDADVKQDSIDPPGSAGLHCLLAFDYDGMKDDSILHLPTWGMLQPATWRWVESRVQEAHVVVWRSMQQASGVNWNGVNYDQMEMEALSI